MGSFLLDPEECADFFIRVADAHRFELLRTPEDAACALCGIWPAPTDFHAPESLAAWINTGAPALLGNIDWLPSRYGRTHSLDARSVRAQVAPNHSCMICKSQLGTTVFIPKRTLLEIHPALSLEEEEFLATQFTLDVCGVCRDNERVPQLSSSDIRKAFMAAARLERSGFRASPGSNHFMRIANLIDDCVRRAS